VLWQCDKARDNQLNYTMYMPECAGYATVSWCCPLVYVRSPLDGAGKLVPIEARGGTMWLGSMVRTSVLYLFRIYCGNGKINHDMNKNCPKSLGREE